MKLKRILAIVLVIAAIAFGVAGFIVPPTGVISSSVLWFVAQSYLMAATLIGVDIEYIKLLKK